MGERGRVLGRRSPTSASHPCQRTRDSGRQSGRSRVVHTLAQRRLQRPHHLSDFRVPPNQPDCPLHDSTSVPLCPWSPPHRAPHRVPWLHCRPLAW